MPDPVIMRIEHDGVPGVEIAESSTSRHSIRLTDSEAKRVQEDLDNFLPECLIREELHCEDCHRYYSPWFADNELWNAVIRPNGEQYGEPFLCSTCFLIRASIKGICIIARISHAPNDPARS